MVICSQLETTKYFHWGSGPSNFVVKPYLNCKLKMDTILWFCIDFFLLCYLKSDENPVFLSIQVGKGDYHSDLYSACSIWPTRTAASSLAVTLRLTHLQKILFHILLRETLSFKLCNVIQGSWNQLEESSPNLAELEGARLVPEWLVTNMFWVFLLSSQLNK